MTMSRQQVGVALTLTKVDFTFRKLGTPIHNIIIMLNISIHYNVPRPSKNILKLSHTR